MGFSPMFDLAYIDPIVKLLDRGAGTDHWKIGIAKTQVEICNPIFNRTIGKALENAFLRLQELSARLCASFQTNCSYLYSKEENVERTKNRALNSYAIVN